MSEFGKCTTTAHEECAPIDEYLKMRNILSAIKMMVDLDSLSYEDRIFHIKAFLENLSEEQYDLCVSLTDKRIDHLESKLEELGSLRNMFEAMVDDMNYILDGDSND